MKKIIALLIAALMLLTLAACGGTENGTAAPDATESTAAPVSDAADTAAPTDADPVSDAPAENAYLPGRLYQLGDPENPVVLGLNLSGNQCGSEELNGRPADFADIRCVFELDEWVEVTPDTDAEDGLAVWVFAHRENADEYKDAALTEETPGFAAYCGLPYDAEAGMNAPRGSFYLNPEEAEAGYYDLVFTFEGRATALLVTRFYNPGELTDKTDEELWDIMRGL